MNELNNQKADEMTSITSIGEKEPSVDATRTTVGLPSVSEDDKKILTEARERCDEIEAENWDIFEDIRKAAAFVGGIDGSQWDSLLKTDRELNLGGPRPVLTMNKIQAYVNRVTNDERMNRPGLKMLPRNEGVDPLDVEISQGLVRDITNGCDAETALDTAMDCAATGGIGYYAIKTRYEDSYSFNQEIYLDRILDPLKVLFPMHHSKEIDFSDCDYCFLIDDISHDEYKRLYSDKDADLSSWTTHIDSPWVTEKTLRRAFYYRKIKNSVKIKKLSDGSTVEGDPLLPEGITVVRERETEQTIVEWYLITSARILSRGIIAGEMLPIVPCVGKEMVVEGKRRFKGVANDAFDSQKMLNYWKSNLAEHCALAPKAQWMVGEGQDEGYENEYKMANQANIVSIHYKPKTFEGVLLPPPQRVQVTPPPPAIIDEINSCDNDIKTIIGLPDVNMGKSKNERSGKAILANQREGELMNYHFADNHRKSLVAGWKIIAGMIPVVYDTPRVVRIMGPAMEEKLVKINQQYVDDLGTQRQHDLTKLKFTVVAETGPSYSSRREETAGFLMELVQYVPNIGPGLIDLIAKAIGADEEVVDRCKELLPPNIKHSAIDPKQVPPAVRQVLKQMEDGIQKANFLITQKDNLIKQLSDAIKDKSAERDVKMKVALVKADAEITKAKMSMAHEHAMQVHEHVLSRQKTDNLPADDTGEQNQTVPAR